MPGPLLLLGAPGVGKGTQAKILMDALRIPQISTGDLLRQNRKDHTPLGMMADELMQRGALVPDDLVNKMVAERLGHDDCGRGYILDGFPRTVAQADWLDAYLAEHKALPLVAIHINVPHDELLKRITGRRVSVSGAIYNIYTNPPTADGKCDVDGSPLQQRSDDTEVAFEKRMREFAEKTGPAIDHYRRQGRFSEVDGSASVEQVSHDIRAELLRQRSEAS